MRAEDIYKGRRPKLRELQGSTQILRQVTRQRGEKNTSAEPVRGHYDVDNGWLRGQGSPYSSAYVARKK